MYYIRIYLSIRFNIKNSSLGNVEVFFNCYGIPSPNSQKRLSSKSVFFHTFEQLQFFTWSLLCCPF